MNFQSSQTYRNLQAAFEGECKANGKYQIYGTKAKEDGYEEIAEVFLETAVNEKEHAEIWLKYLNHSEIPDTKDNLTDAIQGESYEWHTMYQEFANVARKEGYDEIAEMFDNVAMIERHHDFRYRKYLEELNTNTNLCKKEPIMWICMNCGNLYWGKCAPEKCPVCGYPQGFFKPMCDCM